MALRWADNWGWLTAAHLTRAYTTVDDGSGSIAVGPYGRGGGDGLRFSGDRLAYIGARTIAGVSGATAVQQEDLRISAAPASVTPLFRIYDGSSVQATLALLTDRTLQVYRGDLTTALGSASSYVVPLNTWISLGWLLTISDAAGIARVHVWEPGDTAEQVVLNLSSQDTKATSNATWDGFDVHAACAGTTDVANHIVADGSGGVNDTLFGPADVITRVPNGVGASSDFVPSSGLTNYLMVDDPSADDAVTTVGCDTEGDHDTYAHQDVPDPSQTVIGAVAIVVAKHAADIASFAHAIRHAGADTFGSDVALSTGFLAYPKPYDQLPGSVTFTPTLFNAAEFGAKVTDITVSGTRLYLSTHAAGFTPTNFRGAWDYTTDQVTAKIQTVKDEIGANDSFAEANHDTAAADWDLLVYRGVSDPLGAQTISGDFTGCVNGRGGSFADHDMKFHVHVYVTAGDTDTVRGTLLSDFVDTTTWTGWQGQEIPSQTLSSVAAQAGDRVVVELGTRTSNMSVPTFHYYAAIHYKATAERADSAPLDGDSDTVSWVEFSNPLVFQ